MAWDPRGKYLASESSDRSCRIYKPHKTITKGNKLAQVHCCNSLSKRQIPNEEDPNGQPPATHRLFLDEAISSYVPLHLPLMPRFLTQSHPLQNRFFRRLTWTVDGSFLITPMGQHQVNSEQQPYPVTYLCHRNKLNTYCIPVLSSPTTTTTGVDK